MPIPKKGLDIISKTSQIIDGHTDEFIKGLSAIENAIIRLTMDKISRMPALLKDTKANAKLLQSLRRELIREMRAGKLAASAREFVLSFDKVLKGAQSAHKVINGFEIKESLFSQTTNNAITTLEKNLFGEGMVSSVVDPVIEHSRRLISLNTDAKTLEKELRRLMKKSASIERYAGQIATDSLAQYRGALDSKVADEFGLEWTVYSGSIIATSRKQCRRWVALRYLHDSELQKQIDWAFANGSGMIDPTTPPTFKVNRGGHRCRHAATSISSILVPDSAFDRLGLERN